MFNSRLQTTEIFLPFFIRNIIYYLFGLDPDLVTASTRDKAFWFLGVISLV